MKSKKYLWLILISLLSIGTIATTITVFSCSNNASSENDSSNNKPPTDNDLPNNPEEPVPPITPEEPKPPVTEEEKDNWNSYPSNEFIKIKNIKSWVQGESFLYIEINGQNLSTNINDYKIIINETGEDFISHINSVLEFSPYVNQTKDKITIRMNFGTFNNMIAILDKLSCKKFIILIDNKAPILESSAISSNIFPGPMSFSSISLKIEYDENNQPISLIYKVNGKNLYMDYNINDLNLNEKIVIRLVGDQYNLSFKYEFLSDLSNTNEFIVKLSLQPNDFKKISSKKYTFIIVNKWQFNIILGDLYFPNF